MSALGDAFRAALPEEARAAWEALPTLDDALGAWLARATAAWPELTLRPEGLGAHLARLLAGAEDPLVALHGSRAEELALVWATLDGQTGALTLLEAQMLGPVGAALERAGWARAADAMSELREVMLVGPRPKLLGYAGRGDLRLWLEVSATRIAGRLNERHAREVATGPSLEALIGVGDDPELARIRAEHVDVFRTALEAAIAGLTPRERTLLRQRHLDGSTWEELAALHGVHGATVRRWADRAERAVLVETRRRLSANLRLSSSQIDSLLAGVQSRLDLSMAAMLKTMAGVVALLVCLLLPRAAHADKAASLIFHEQGKAAYDAGRFDDAARAYEQAYAAYPSPAYLFNLGRARRPNHPCEAADAFRKFLATNPSPALRRDVDRWMKADAPKCTPPASASPSASAPVPPAPAVAPASAPVVSAPASPTSSPAPAPVSLTTTARPATPAHHWLQLSAFATFERWYAGPVHMPFTPAVTASARLRFGRVGRVWGGVSASYRPIAFDDLATGTSHVATIGASNLVEIVHRFGIRTEVALVRWWGIGEGNPFTADGSALDASWTARGAVGLTYRTSTARSDFALELEPITVGWVAAPEGFAPDIEELWTVGAALGFSWRR